MKFALSLQDRLLTVEWPEEIVQTSEAAEVSGEAETLFRGLRVKIGVPFGNRFNFRTEKEGKSIYWSPKTKSLENVEVVRPTLTKFNGYESQEEKGTFISINQLML